MPFLKFVDYLPEELKTKYFEFKPRAISDEDFCKSLLDQIRISHAKCKYYREKTCERFDFTVPDEITIDSLETIPYIPSSTYKESKDIFLDLLKVTPDKIALFSCSSSTTGDPSIVPRTVEDFDQLQYNTINCYYDFFHWEELAKGKDCLTFNFSPNRQFMSVMASINLNNKKHKKEFGKKVRYFTCCMNKPWEFIGHEEYLIRMKLLKSLWAVISSFSLRGGFVLDVSRMLKIIRKVLDTGEWKDKKFSNIILGGSPLLMNNMLEKRLIPEGIKLDLSEIGRVVTGGGGWDGVKGQAKMNSVHKTEFIESIESTFNISRDKIGDIYGFTESPVLFGGHWSEKYQDFLLHCPNTARIIVRDIEKLEPVEKGEEGLLEVITPYGVNGSINQAVLIDDIVELISIERCPDCGYEGAVFRVIGRLENAQGKSCSSLINWIY
ncbi:MAG: LuxE/PaaK family acyltransferase [Candidatus Helarchaeales archaeon]